MLLGWLEHTGKAKIIKFEGVYGMCSEAQMSLAPSKLANFPIALPDSAGIPESVRSEVLMRHLMILNL